MKHDTSSISTSKDQSKLNFVGLKQIRDNEFDLSKLKGDQSMNHSGFVENCSSVTTIKRSKAIDQNLKSFGDKTSTNNQRIKEMSNQIAESLYATQSRLAKMKNVPTTVPSKSKEKPSYKNDTHLKYKMKSSEEFRNLTSINIPSKGIGQKKVQNGIKRKATVESFVAKDVPFGKDSFESSLNHKQHKN